jgi:hypothetical protein
MHFEIAAALVPPVCTGKAAFLKERPHVSPHAAFPGAAANGKEKDPDALHCLNARAEQLFRAAILRVRMSCEVTRRFNCRSISARRELNVT